MSLGVILHHLALVDGPDPQLTLDGCDERWALEQRSRQGLQGLQHQHKLQGQAAGSQASSLPQRPPWPDCWKSSVQPTPTPTLARLLEVRCAAYPNAHLGQTAGSQVCSLPQCPPWPAWSRSQWHHADGGRLHTPSPPPAAT